MPEISVARVAEVESLKTAIGWNWLVLGERIGWGAGPVATAKFRSQKMAIEDDQLRYLREVAAAVQAVPLPGSAPAEDYAIASSGDWDLEPARVEAAQPFNEIGEKLAAAGYAPPPRQPEVRAMLMDDIARKLAEEYFTLANDPELQPNEASIAKSVISRVALKLGVVDEVRAIVTGGARQAVQAVPVPLAPQPRPSYAEAAPAYRQPERVPFEF